MSKRKFRPESESLYDRTNIQDDSGDMSASNVGGSKAAADAAVKMAEGGSVTDAAGTGLMTYGTATANPYAIGAGAAIQVISAKKKREQSNEILQQKAKLERISRQQKALVNLTSVSQSLRNL